MRLRELPELFRGGESPSRRENKIVYAVWDSSGCLSRLGEHGKENGLHHYAGSYPIVGRLREGWPKFHIERAGDIRFSFSLPSTTFLYRRVFLTLLSISTFHSCSRGCLRKTRIKARRAMHRAQSFAEPLVPPLLRGASLRAGACSFSFRRFRSVAHIRGLSACDEIRIMLCGAAGSRSVAGSGIDIDARDALRRFKRYFRFSFERLLHKVRPNRLRIAFSSTESIVLLLS